MRKAWYLNVPIRPHIIQLFIPPLFLFIFIFVSLSFASPISLLDPVSACLCFYFLKIKKNLATKFVFPEVNPFLLQVRVPSTGRTPD